MFRSWFLLFQYFMTPILAYREWLVDQCLPYGMRRDAASGGDEAENLHTSSSDPWASNPWPESHEQNKTDLLGEESNICCIFVAIFLLYEYQTKFIAKILFLFCSIKHYFKYWRLVLPVFRQVSYFGIYSLHYKIWNKIHTTPPIGGGRARSFRQHSE